jgi:DNA repair protein RadC
MEKTATMQVAEITLCYKPAISNKPIVTTSLDAYNVIYSFFDADNIALQEQIVVLYLNRANRVIGIYKLSTGGITGTVVDIRLILSVALKSAATGLIIAHNHPSSSLKPSRQDEDISSKLTAAGNLMDIKLFDHLIVCPEEGKYLSFADEGFM